jgi:superfamily II DNA/RNA helicase
MNPQIEKSSYSTDLLQGNFSQQEWQKPLGRFQDGTLKIFVSMDIATSGIDVFRIPISSILILP